MFGSEPHLPYQRPPLSKKYLSGEWEPERLHLRPLSFWTENAIKVHTGTSVTSIDVAAGTLLCGGQTIGWDRLALTTGATPRPLPPGFDGLDGVFELRTLADVDRLRSRFLPGRRLLVIGGGFIGLETAAVAVKSGLEVTVVELAERILERVVCSETSAYFRGLHEGHGVRIVEGSRVTKVVGGPDLRAVELNTGERIEADLALVGIGVVPNMQLAEDAGIATQNGILVDRHGRTSLPRVWAAGDCAAFSLDGEATRLESVQNAVDQAEAVADDMMGIGRPYEPVPWFWSDQFDVKLQIAGLNRGYTDIVSRRSERGGQSNWYFRAGRLIAVDSINDARSFMTAKKVLAEGISVDQRLLSNPDFEPRALLG